MDETGACRTLPGRAAALCPAQPRTISPHASALVAQNRVDRVAIGLGSALLEAVRAAEFSLLLRHWQYSDWLGPLAGKPTFVFLASLRTAGLPDPIHGRSGRCAAQRSSPDRRHGVHVRPWHSSTVPSPQSVSHSDAA